MDDRDKTPDDTTEPTLIEMDDDSADDAAIVIDPNTDDSTITPTTVNSGELMINMEAMIKNYITNIDKQQGELKRIKEMLSDIFTNDPTYAKHNEAAQEAAKIKAATRAQILKQPQAAELNAKIKETQSEVKENQAALSDYLQEYQRLSGVNEIEDEDGELREIVYTAKLVRKPFVPK